MASGNNENCRPIGRAANAKCQAPEPEVEESSYRLRRYSAGVLGSDYL
jgi:hypothetical protein